MSIKKIKEYFSNKKYRALTILFVYILFFTLIFSVMSFDEAKNYYEEKDNSFSSSSLFRLENYEFHSDIEFLNEVDFPINKYSVDGKTYGKNTLFYVNETMQTYFIENDIYYVFTNGQFQRLNEEIFDINKLSVVNIYSYLTHANKESTTNYENGNKKESYSMSVNDFSKLYMEEISNKEGYVYIDTYYSDNKLTKIILNLGNYNNTKISIEYNKINEVKKFTKEDTLSM